MTLFLLIAAAAVPIAGLYLAARAYQRRQTRLDHDAVDSHSPRELSEDERLDAKWDQRWADSDAAFWRANAARSSRDYAAEDRAADLYTHRALSIMERSIYAEAGRRADRLARALHRHGPAWRVFKATDAVDLRAMLMLMDGWHGWCGSTTDTQWTEADSAAFNEYAAIEDARRGLVSA